jgi:hypothetical protein
VDDKENLPSDEQIIMNMINSFLGRMHLASDLSLLGDEQFSLVSEGVEYYKSLSKVKKSATPYFPCGFTRYGEDFVSAGFETEEKIYLAAWNLGGKLCREIPILNATSAKCAYPQNNDLLFSLNNGRLNIEFTEKYQARFFEIEK